MSASRALRLGILIAALTSACAKPAQSPPAPAADRTDPPRLLTRVSYPELTMIEPNPTGRASLRMNIQVMIDSLGRADTRTLRLTGEGGMQNRIAIERWLESVTFRPATRNGQPVSGLYKLTLEVRVVVR
jgi:type IV pilus biogenesis protein CpaD/CtpE